MSPFEVIYGRSPPAVPDYLPQASQVEVVDTLLTSRDDVLAKLKRNLLKAQMAMKQIADNHRRDVEFAVGDWVYVRLRPYRQVSVAGHNNYNKLLKRFFGPYQITERLGKVAYRLELPSNSKIHPIFHCSVLKPHQGPPTDTLSPLPAAVFRTVPYSHLLQF